MEPRQFNIDERITRLERMLALHVQDGLAHNVTEGYRGYHYDPVTNLEDSMTVWGDVNKTTPRYREERFYKTVGVSTRLVAVVSTIYLDGNNLVVKRFEYEYDAAGNNIGIRQS